MADAHTTITGVPELAATLAKLQADMRAGVARRAVGAAATVVRNAARSNIDGRGLVATGTMRRNVVYKYERSAPIDAPSANVGVRHGRGLIRRDRINTQLVLRANGRIAKVYVDDPYYWRFHEFGTKKMPARPFLGPALEQSRQQAIDAMAKLLHKAVIKQEGLAAT